MPSCLIHFILRAETTLTFGGHFIRGSHLVPWLETVLFLRHNDQMTNEMEEATLISFAIVVGQIIIDETHYSKASKKAAGPSKDLQKQWIKWGGRAAVDKYWKLIQVRPHLLRAACVIRVLTAPQRLHPSLSKQKIATMHPLTSIDDTGFPR